MSKKPELTDEQKKNIRRLYHQLGDPKQAVAETLLGEDNNPVDPGESIIHKSRIFDGDTNRLANFLSYLELKCQKPENKLKLGKLRVSLFGASIGYCKDIPDFGMREELIELFTQRQAKKEPIQPQTQTPKQQQQQNNNAPQQEAAA